MAFASLIKYYASSTTDAIDKFVDTAVSAGWTIHDDLSGASPYSYVLTSSGTSGEEWPAYLRLSQGSNRIQVDQYVYWDNSSHTGNVRITSNNEYITSLDSGSFYIWCSATEDSAVFDTYVSSQHQSAYICLLNSFDAYAALGVTQSGVSSGSDVVLQLDTGEAERFVAGTSYQIVGTINHEFVEVSSVDKALDTITIASLSYDFATGSRIGVLPHRWGLLRYQYWRVLALNWNGPTDLPSYANVTAIQPFGRYDIDPDNRTQKYPMSPYLLSSYSNTGITGYTPIDHSVWMRCHINSNHELPLAVGRLDIGTSSGSNTSTTLNDISKSWTINEFSNKVLIITGGPGVGQFRKIASNTSTELTISEAFDTLPDNSSEYVICNQGWQYLYAYNSYDYCGAMRVL